MRKSHIRAIKVTVAYSWQSALNFTLSGSRNFSNRLTKIRFTGTYGSVLSGAAGR